MISANRLRELLDYNPDTGVIRWRADRRPGIKAGDEAGRIWSYRGTYRYVVVEGRSYKAHRLAWLYMTGEWPSKNIDHVNGDGLDNSWRNLRLANQSQNGANRRKQRSNTSGYKGVSFHTATGRYAAQIKRNGKHFHLGLFDAPEAAHAAYVAAAEKHFGEFARAA